MIQKENEMMQFENVIIKILRMISFVMFVIMIVVVFAQVMLRYFFGAPLAWSDELARLLLIWISFMGVTLVHYTKAGHPAVTFLIEKAPVQLRKGIELFLNLLLAVCFIFICRASLEYTISNHRFVSAVLHYPNSVKYAVVPICMALMAIKNLIHSFDLVKKLLQKS